MLTLAPGGGAGWLFMPMQLPPWRWPGRPGSAAADAHPPGCRSGPRTSASMSTSPGRKLVKLPASVPCVAPVGNSIGPHSIVERHLIALGIKRDRGPERFEHLRARLAQ